jgi:3-isopropylmalate/(R)-2-methylmalate dehydratase small subunit
MSASREGAPGSAAGPIEMVKGRGLPLRGDDIDTDRIIPARYLRCVTFEGIGEHAFEDDRRALAGAAGRDPAARPHPFDDTRFQGASILVVNRNFGCGSSREHAPQALLRRGIRGLVGESFAEIFFGNCVALGIPCFTMPADSVKALQEAIEKDPGLEIVLDVRGPTLTAEAAGKLLPAGPAAIPEGAREAFLGGAWDATGLLLQRPEEIESVYRSLPYTRQFAR